MRIWDQFLTERDKRHLERVTHPPKVGFGDKPALILIDNYKAGLGDEPLPLDESIKKYPLSMGLEAWRAVEQQKRLLDLCRELAVPVIHTNLNAAAQAPLEFYTALRLSPERRTMSAVRSRINPDGDMSMFDFCDELAPGEDEIVILKTGPSIFAGTPLVSTLHYLGVDTLIVCGESTSGCVRASVVDAGTLCFRTIVVEECVYDRTEASHAMALFDMDQKYADVLGVEEVTSWLRSWSGRNADRKIAAIG